MLLTLLAAAASTAAACPPLPPAPVAATSLTAEKPATVPLRAMKAGDFPVPPGKAPTPGTNGATLGFSIPTDGRWQVAAGAPVWIDVVRDGRSIASTTHGHGKPCTGFRKAVVFPLKAGAHQLQLSGGTVASVRVEISPAE